MRVWKNIRFFVSLLFFSSLFLYLCYWGFSYVRDYIYDSTNEETSLVPDWDKAPVETEMSPEERQRKMIEERKLVMRLKEGASLQSDMSYSDMTAGEASSDELDEVDFRGGEVIPDPVEGEDDHLIVDEEESSSESEGQGSDGEGNNEEKETPIDEGRNLSDGNEEKLPQHDLPDLGAGSIQGSDEPKLEPGNPAPPEPPKIAINKKPIRASNVPRTLDAAMRYYKAKKGDPVFIRIVKDIRNLELWMQPGGKGDYVLVKDYPVLGMSGKLGPKEKKGDLQAPEGFYRTYKHALNPNSSYHLSFNVGYPNQWDKLHNRTGSLIMIHGNNVSVGCYAMGDPEVEEIYQLVEAHVKTRRGAKGVPIQVYPFIPTPIRLFKEQKSKHYHFWCFLAEAWYWTEEHREPAPVVLRSRSLCLDGKAELHVDLAGNNRYENKRILPTGPLLFPDSDNPEVSSTGDSSGKELVDAKKAEPANARQRSSKDIIL